MLLYLIRHGTTAHTGKKLTGWMPGVGLSSAGRSEVGSMVERMRDVSLDALYSSPIQRTMETAEPLAQAKKLKIRTRKDLGEVRYGDWEGRSLATLAKAKMWRVVQNTPSAVRFPGGESLIETQARAVAGIEELRIKHRDQTIAVVTHADVIRLLAAHYAGVHVDLYQRFVIEPASVSVLWLGTSTPYVLKLNDTGRLAPPPRPKAAAKTTAITTAKKEKAKR